MSIMIGDSLKQNIVGAVRKAVEGKGPAELADKVLDTAYEALEESVPVREETRPEPADTSNTNNTNNTNKKKRFHPLTLLPAAALLIGLGCAGVTAWVSLVNYKPMKGIFGSAFVGLSNYTKFINSTYFVRIVSNTLVQNGLLLALALLLATLLMLFVGTGKKPARILTKAAVCLIPACVPYSFTAGLLINLLPAAFLRAAESGWYLPVAAMLLQQTALLTFCGGLFAYLGKRGIGKGAGEGLCIGFLICLLRLLTGEFDAVYACQSSLNASYSETLDSYAFKISLTNAQFSVGSAVFTLKMAAQTLLAVIPAVLLSKKAKADETRVDLPDVKKRSFLFGLSAFKWFYALVLCVILPFALNKIEGGIEEIGGTALSTAAQSIQYIVNSAVIALAGGLLTAIVWTAALSFLKPGVKGFGFFAVAVSMLAGAWTLGGYLLSRQIGLINTLYPVILRQVFSSRTVLLVLLLAVIYRKAPERDEKAVFLMLMFAGMAFAWGDTQSPLVYITNRSLYPVSMYLRQIMSSGTAVVGQSSENAGSMMAQLQTVKSTAELLMAVPPMLFGTLAAGACIRAFGKKE